MATQHLLDAIKGRPDVRFVNASSSSVYGDAEVFPTPETAPTRPRSPYGQTKLSAEHLCSLYRANYGVDELSLRFFTVYGPRQRPDMAFHIFCRAVIEGQPVRIFGDGNQTRDFTYVGDVVAAVIAAAESQPGDERIFNVGGGTPTSIRQVLDLVGTLADRRVDVSYLDQERGDVKDTAADTTLARDKLGFAPRTTLEAGLGAEFAWLEGLVAQERGSLADRA